MSLPAEHPALDVRRPFTRAEAVAAGISTTRLRGPLFRRVLHGVYVSAAVPVRRWERIEAALAFHPDSAYASHTSAARLYRLPVPTHLTDEHVTVPRRGDRRSRRGVRCHLALPGQGPVTVAGLPASSPSQLFLEMAGLLDLVDLVTLGDALVRWHSVRAADLVAAASSSRGRHARAARRAAGYVRDEVDSPMESRLRMLIVLAGLPEPRVNHTIRRVDGRVRYRFDLSYPEAKLAVEYDGRQHRDDLDQWDRDLERDDWLDEHGWLIVKVVARGLFREPDKTLLRVRRALVARGVPVPRRLRDEWQPFFRTP